MKQGGETAMAQELIVKKAIKRNGAYFNETLFFFNPKSPFSQVFHFTGYL
jgi:hypothetical protein